ncbi:hypothetical protein C2S51_026034 [Perilla frutescens var. frutescens]|nr:hypothetical protein C2S51_026034 [Perilla frutescens var. frutescens]
MKRLRPSGSSTTSPAHLHWRGHLGFESIQTKCYSFAIKPSGSYLLQISTGVPCRLGSQHVSKAAADFDSRQVAVTHLKTLNSWELHPSSWTSTITEVSSLHSQEPPNCWSLPVVTLTTIEIALPNTPKTNQLLSSIKEGLSPVKYVEKVLDSNEKLQSFRNAAYKVWEELRQYRKWQGIDLQSSSLKGKSLKETLQNLSNVAKKKCQRNSIKERQDNVREAVLLLGESQEILEFLQPCRLPRLDPFKAANIDEWRAFLQQGNENLTAATNSVSIPTRSMSLK